MADSDKEYKISITTTADTGGLKQTSVAMDSLGVAASKAVEGHTDLAEGLEKAEKKMEGVSGESREMYRIFTELDRIAPDLGESVRAIFTEPIGAVGFLVFGLYQAKQAWDEFNKAEEKAAEVAAQPDFIDAIEKQSEAVGQAGADWQAFSDGIQTALNKNNDLNESLKSSLSLLQAMERAQAALVSAKKAEAIANLQAEENAGLITPAQAAAGRAAIDQNYEAQQAAEREKALNDEMNAKQNALIQAQNQQDALTKQYQDADARQRADQAHADDINIDPKDQLKKIQDAQAALDAANDHLAWAKIAELGWKGQPGSEEFQTQQEAEQAVARATAQLHDLQEQFVRYQESQSPEAQAKIQADKDAAKVAKKAADDNATLVGDLTKEIVDLKATIAATLPVQRQTTATEQVTAEETALGNTFKQINQDLNVHGAGAQQALLDARDALQTAVAILQNLAALGVDVAAFKQKLDQLAKQAAALPTNGTFQ